MARISCFVSLFVALLAVTISAPTAAQEFSRTDYADATSRKKLPKPTKAGPLAAVDRYLSGMTYLDRARIAVEALADSAGRRIYRVELICRSAEACADDSVAATREALEVRRGSDGGWVVVWVGAQVKCHQGRGHQDWLKAPCR